MPDKDTVMSFAASQKGSGFIYRLNMTSTLEF